MPDLEGQLERAVAALARYYGATSRSDFASLFVRSREGATAGAPLEVPNPTPAQAASQALLNITDGGLTTPELLASIEERVGGAASSQDGNDVKGLLRVCHEPPAEGQNNSGVLLGRDIRVGSQNEVQGVSPSDGEIYSVRDTLGLGGQSDSSNPINEPGDAAAGCNLAAIQVFANRLSPASRDLGALTLFMNAIPTLEISRAVPFIDVVLIQEGAAVQGTSEAEGRLASLSLGQFLLGNARVEGTPHPTLTATDLQVLGDQARQPDFPGDSDRAQPSPISTAGMELFTSPQTLVNADEAHFEDSELTGNVEEQLRRQSPIIDRFRPLMTLKSLNLSVVGSGGIMSYKSGKMSLTLHDRSRLAEVSAFVRPARYGSNHILLEYGWSHPDAPAQGGPIGSDNPIGNFIGALRAKEKYQIVNSSFSFDEVGQVQIELTLSMLSTRGLRQVNIGLGPSENTAFSTVKNIIDLVGQIRSRLNSTLAAQITGESDVIGSLTSPASVLSLSPDAIKELRKVIRATSSSSSSSLSSLNNQLKDLIGDGSGGALGGAAAQLRSGIRAEIGRKTDGLTRGPDPFLVNQRITTRGNTSISIDKPSYVSLGKLLLKFVGQPIATSGYYRDVQFIFYNFNDRASYMANRNIATFPVEVSELRTLLERQLDQMLNMTTESFIGFIDGGFISAPSAKPYGFSGFYHTPRPRNGEEAQGPQLSKEFEEDAAKLASEQQEILKRAYGNADEDDGDYEFVQPTISFVTESVPLRSNPSDPRTLLRIHIFDGAATSHTCVQQLLEAASDRSIGLINSAAAEARQSINRARAGEEGASQDTANADVIAYNEQVNAAVTAGLLEEYPPAGERPSDSRTRANRLRLKGGMPALKGFISRTMPSVRYGEGASGITSAKVQSMSDPGLTTVNILRQGTTPDTPASARFNGVPLQVAPVECTLETIGCPLWSFGQQLFIDFGTGTSIDAVYGVVGVDHTIGPGEYKTTVKLTPMGSYAKYESLFRNVRDATIVMDALESPPEQQ
jgi:hypothetical protein